MTMTLSPALEQRLQHFVDLGRFENAEQAMECAVAHLEIQMTQIDEILANWSREELQAMVDEGIESMENEPLVTGEEVRAHLARLRVELVDEPHP